MASQEKLINAAPLPRSVTIRMLRSNLLVERGRMDSGIDHLLIACLKQSQVWS